MTPAIDRLIARASALVLAVAATSATLAGLDLIAHADHATHGIQATTASGLRG